MTPTAPLRVAIVGCGNIALNHHVPAYQARPDLFRIVAVVDPNPERLELARRATRLSREHVHSDGAALVGRRDVDLVDVCTPQHLRRDLVVALAGVGKHLICEKPLASVPADALAMIEAAELAGVVLAVVHNYLFLEEVMTARAVIDSGEIGDVRAVTVNYLGVTDSPGAAGYDPQWRKDPRSSGGGVLMDMLHAVYLAEHLLGRPLEAAGAYVDATRPDAGQARVEDIALCRFEADGAAALVNVAWGFGPGGIQVTGTLGRIVVRYRDDGTPPWAPFDQVSVTTEVGTRIAASAGPGLSAALSAAMAATLQDLAEAIAGPRRPAATGRDGLRILQATLAAYASAAVGGVVATDFPRDHPVFTDGAGGLSALALSAASPIRTKHLFDVAEPAAARLT